MRNTSLVVMLFYFLFAIILFVYLSMAYVAYYTWIQDEQLITMWQKITGFFSIVVCSSGIGLVILSYYFFIVKKEVEEKLQGVKVIALFFIIHVVAFAMMHHSLGVYSVTFAVELVLVFIAIFIYQRKINKRQ